MARTRMRGYDNQRPSRRRFGAAVALAAAVAVLTGLAGGRPAPAGGEDSASVRTATGALLKIGSVVGVAARNADGLCVVTTPIAVEVEVAGDVAPEVVWEFTETCAAVITEINWPDAASSSSTPIDAVPEVEE